MLRDALDPEFESPRGSWKIRWILLSAFGGMLLLMIFAGADSLRSLRKLHQVSGEVSQRFSARSEALIAVVVTVHTYTDQMEEYLLSDAAISHTVAPAEIQKHGQEVHTAVEKYPRDCCPQARSLLAKIDEGIARQEGSFAGMLARRADERKQRGHAFVYDELIPRKMELLRLASTVAELNDQELRSENQALATQFEKLQTRLGRTIALPACYSRWQLATTFFASNSTAAGGIWRSRRAARSSSVSLAAWSMLRKPRGDRFPASCTTKLARPSARCWWTSVNCRTCCRLKTESHKNKSGASRRRRKRR